MLYHRVPNPFLGRYIHPLSTLAAALPTVHLRAVSKYDDRPQVPDNYIPSLQCTWRDVVFLGAVHPYDMKQVLIECGHAVDHTMRSFAIDPSTLELERLAVLRFRPNTKRPVHYYEAFDPRKLAEYATIGDAAREHYRDMAERGEWPFLYHQVTQILYRGDICVDGLQIEEG
jgi:hypothetical protein